jgi:hypothetical protein
MERHSFNLLAARQSTVSLSRLAPNFKLDPTNWPYYTLLHRASLRARLYFTAIALTSNAATGQAMCLRCAFGRSWSLVQKRPDHHFVAD